MTPCINYLIKAKVPYQIHEYEHDSDSKSYGLEAVEKLGQPDTKIFKTLVIDCGANDLAVAVISVAKSLNLKSCAKFLKTKKATMADAKLVERVTGYILGGVSPLGQKKRLKTIVDISAMNQETIFISASRRGLEVEISPHDLTKLTSGLFCDISQ